MISVVVVPYLDKPQILIGEKQQYSTVRFSCALRLGIDLVFCLTDLVLSKTVSGVFLKNVEWILLRGAGNRFISQLPTNMENGTSRMQDGSWRS